MCSTIYDFQLDREGNDIGRLSSRKQARREESNVLLGISQMLFPPSQCLSICPTRARKRSNFFCLTNTHYEASYEEPNVLMPHGLLNPNAAKILPPFKLYRLRPTLTLTKVENAPNEAICNMLGWKDMYFESQP